MDRPRILLQLDRDAHPSVFDSVVAIDAAVEHLLRHGNVDLAEVRKLVHGLIFTRGPQDLNRSAIFIGGSSVTDGESLLQAVREVFFGPFRVSVMLDANGANSTAAAAVLAAQKVVPLAGKQALVLAATGPVGQRVARLLARQGAIVRVASRRIDRAEEVVRALHTAVPTGQFTAVATEQPADLAAALAGVEVLIAAGSAGVELLSVDARRSCPTLKVAVDLNAVPPVGLAGIELPDRGVTRDGVVCYGAIGVGGTKMKIHRAAVNQLFERNDQIFDADEIFDLGAKL